jgi:tetratricopeptide (TPR) repeat protein
LHRSGFWSKLVHITDLKDFFMKIMRVFSLLAAMAAIWGTAATAWALDTIKKVDGTSISGKFLQTSREQVEFEQGAGENKSVKQIPANQIVTIFFDGGSPLVKKSLNSAKTQIAIERHYAEGLKSLAKIKASEIDLDYLQQDYDFYNALATAKLAFAGTGKIQDAGKLMMEFVKNEKNSQSYHYFEACEVLGDLLVAVRSYPLAEEYYGKLAQASWPEAKIKAGVLLGRAQLAQNKFAEAANSFQSVIDDKREGPLAQSLRLSALVGKASVLTGQKKPDEAVKILRGIIDKADGDSDDPKDAELLSHTCNALGAAHRQLGDLKEARIAFLMTDQLYSSTAEAHAEALANLAEIWGQLHQPERAVEARKTLERLYPNSPWAKGEGK